MGRESGRGPLHREGRSWPQAHREDMPRGWGTAQRESTWRPHRGLEAGWWFAGDLEPIGRKSAVSEESMPTEKKSVLPQRGAGSRVRTQGRREQVRVGRGLEFYLVAGRPAPVGAAVPLGSVGGGRCKAGALVSRLLAAGRWVDGDPHPPLPGREPGREPGQEPGRDPDGREGSRSIAARLET